MTTPAPLPDPAPALESVIEEVAGVLPDPKLSVIGKTPAFYQTKSFWALMAISLGLLYFFYKKGSELDETDASDETQISGANHAAAAQARTEPARAIRSAIKPASIRSAPAGIFGSNE